MRRVMSDVARVYARIVSMQLRLDGMDAAFAYYRDISTPLVRGQPGSLGVLGAGNRESGSALALSFWSSQEDLERSNGNPAVVAAMTGYAQWMAGPFVVASYDVASGTPPPPATAARWLRATTMLSLPARLEETIATVRNRLQELESIASACQGTMLLTPHIGERVIALEFWSSQAALAASNKRADDQERRLWRAGLLERPPEREALEIFGVF